MCTRSRFLVPAVAVIASLVLAGCTGSASLSSAASTSQVLETTAPVSASPTLEPTQVGPSPEPLTDEPTPEPPPVARLVVGARSFRGEIGGYTWKTFAESAPWLPATALDPIAVNPGERLTVKLEGTPVETWKARLARAADRNGHDLVGLGQGKGRIAIEAPRSGSWVLSVSIQYPGNLGSGAYYWSLVVR